MINQFILGEEQMLSNLLNFEKNFSKTNVLRLEQNYRSTKKIF